MLYYWYIVIAVKLCRPILLCILVQKAIHDTCNWEEFNGQTNVAATGSCTPQKWRISQHQNGWRTPVGTRSEQAYCQLLNLVHFPPCRGINVRLSCPLASNIVKLTLHVLHGIWDDGADNDVVDSSKPGILLWACLQTDHCNPSSSTRTSRHKYGRRRLYNRGEGSLPLAGPAWS